MSKEKEALADASYHIVNARRILIDDVERRGAATVINLLDQAGALIEEMSAKEREEG